MRGRLKHIWRLTWTVIGLLLMAVGLIGLFLPTHLLGFVFFVGLTLVLRNSMSWRRRFVRLQRLYPRWVYPFRRLLRGEVVPVVWHEMLRSERFFIPRRFRYLRSWRRSRRERRQARRASRTRQV